MEKGQKNKEFSKFNKAYIGLLKFMFNQLQTYQVSWIYHLHFLSYLQMAEGQMDWWSEGVTFPMKQVLFRVMGKQWGQWKVKLS